MSKHDKPHIKNPGKYRGVYSTGQMPSGVIHKELAREEKVRGRMVQYWHVWVKEKSIPPVFKEDAAEPDKQKIGALTKFFNFFKPADDADL